MDFERPFPEVWPCDAMCGLCLSSSVFQEQLGIGVLGDVLQVDAVHFPGTAVG